MKTAASEPRAASAQFQPLEITTNHSSDTRRAANEPQRFPSLELVTRPTVDTNAAAYYLNRKPQTLRGWACSEDGPLRPMRINGRLAWPVAELRRVLGVTQ